MRIMIVSTYHSSFTMVSSVQSHHLLLIASLGSLCLIAACGGEGNNADNNSTSISDMRVDTGMDMTTGGGSDQGVSPVDMQQGQPDMATPQPDMSTTPPDMTVTPPDQGGMCTDVTVYQDGDGDGYGEGGAMMVCLEAGEDAPDGFARQMGDCNDQDPVAHDGAEGVCNDFVDDDCDGEDEACPTSQPDQMSVPSWDCTGQPPANVYAWASFADGAGYLQDGGCFVFFEGKKDVFYSQRVNISPASADCNARTGCVCPSLNGWPSYDRRLYAFTTSGDPSECEEIALVDHAGEEQPVSNACRKYLYQLHRYDIPYSHVASSLATLERRLTNFSTVEIACLEDAPHNNLPFASLITMEIQYNDGFQKQ